MSEPIFEASVRLRADVGDFEQQAQAAIKDVTTRIEQQSSQALAAAQQRFAQGAPTPTQAGPQPPLQLVPPAAVPPVEVPPVEVPVVADTKPLEAQAAAGVEKVRELASKPVEVPITAAPTNVDAAVQRVLAATTKLEQLKASLKDVEAEAATANEALQMLGEKRFAESDFGTEQPGLEKRLADLQKAVVLQQQERREAQAALREAQAAPQVAPPPTGDLEAALARARAAAERTILEVKVGADTRPFEAQTQAAFAAAEQLASAEAEAAAQASTGAAAQAEAAVTAVTEATGFAAREQAQAAAEVALTTKAAAARAVADTEAALAQIKGEAEQAKLSVPQEFQTRAQTAQTQAETAGLRGDLETQRAKELEAKVLAIQGAEATVRQQSAAFLEAAAAQTGAEKDLLLAQAENAVLSAEKLRAEAIRLQTAGVQAAEGAAAGGAAGAGFRGRIGSAFQSLEELSRHAGGRGGLEQLLSSGARLGAVGIAATAAFQAVGELERSLRVTGDAAFTAQGKFRNFGAELLSANVLGAFKALGAVKPDTFTGPVTEEVARLKELTDDTVISTQELLSLQGRPDPAESANKKRLELTKDISVALEDFLEKQIQTGRLSEDEARAVGEATVSLSKQIPVTEAGTRAMVDYAAAVEKAGGNLDAAFGPDSRDRRGPGAFVPGQNAPAGTVIGQQTTGIPQPIISPGPNPAFQAGTGGTDVAAQIRASITSRIQNEEERLRAELHDKEIAQKIAKATFDSAKAIAQAKGQTDGAAKEWAAYVAATTDVVNAAAAAKAGTEAAAKATQDLAASVRDAWVAAIADPAAQQQAALAEANRKVADAKTALDKTTKGTKEYAEANAAYQIALAGAAGIQNQINYQNQQIAKQNAETAAANKKAGREQALENAITVASFSKRTSDDKNAFDAAIRYWVSLRNNASNVADQEAARAKVIDLYQRRAAALHPAQGAADDLNLLRIQNRIAAAQLTEGLNDDKRFTRQLIDYWRERVKNLKDDAVEREKARSQLIAAQLALKNLQKQQQQQGESPEVFAEALFKEAVENWKQFGTNFSTSATGLLSPQDVRGDFAGNLLGGAQNATNIAQTQRDTMIGELRKISSSVQVIANGPVKRVTGVPIPPDVGKAVAEIGGRVLAGL